MSKNKRQSFVSLDFRLMDDGITNAMGPRFICIYNTLRRYVWRSEEEGDPRVRTYVREGFIISKKGQTKIAEICGVSRVWVNIQIAKMVKMGWVAKAPLRKGGQIGYILGKVDSDGTEKYYLDEWLDQVHASLISCAEKTMSPITGKEVSLRKIDIKTKAKWILDIVEHQLNSEENAGAISGEEDLREVTGCVQGDEHTSLTTAIGVTSGVVNSTPHKNRELSEGYAGNRESSETNVALARGGGDHLLGKEDVLVSAFDYYIDQNKPVVSKKGLKPPLAISPRSGPSAIFMPIDQIQAIPVDKIKWGVGHPNEIDKIAKAMNAPPHAKSEEEAEAPTETTAERIERLEMLRAKSESRTAEQIQKNLTSKALKDKRKKEQRLYNLEGTSVPDSIWPQVKEVWRIWQVEFAKAFPGAPIPKAMDAKTVGQIKLLLEKWTDAQVFDGVLYLLRNWPKLGMRFFKNSGTPPGIGVMVKIDNIIIEAPIWKGTLAIQEEIAAWKAAHPTKSTLQLLPNELEAKRRSIKKTLEDLKLI